MLWARSERSTTILEKVAQRSNRAIAPLQIRPRPRLRLTVKTPSNFRPNSKVFNIRNLLAKINLSEKMKMRK